MLEPIQYFHKNYGINISSIKNIVIGEKYLAVILTNGNMGVCSTLENHISFTLNDFNNIDINNIEHRVAVNAYFNATFNYLNKYNYETDIFDEIDFKQYKNIVMIGYFRSLVAKFERENINLKIFDKKEHESILVKMSLQKEYLAKADAVIISGTTIFNNTFLDLVNSTSNCDIFLLGPSNILHKDMFNYKNIKFVFGSVFNQNDLNVLNVIKNNGCTPEFAPFMKKVFLKNDF